ncbi:MAG: undecaprenyl-diphosphate phosphatase [Rhodospirillales bacterium]|nr:undecaprenyl-diphosphate phosphatase [Rhodospirillales bacterium]
MNLLHIAVLAIIQGITEFLPVSSSGHLVIVSPLMGWPDQGLIIDVAVHVGTLGAVIVYFWRDLLAMAAGIWRALTGRKDPAARLAVQIVLATVPVIAAGYALNHFMPQGIRSLTVVAWATLGFGIVLFVTDKAGMTIRRIEHLGFSDAFVIGMAQILALIPGTSRSGITMSAARILGFERADAARFSMLLSIPTILGAGTLKGFELYQSGNADLTGAAILAAFMAFITALIAIAALMAWLRHATFTPFVIYRIILGGILLGFAYGL